MKPSITLTNSAILATENYRISNDEFRSLHLRVYVAGKGCDGFEYGVSFDEQSADDLAFQISPEVTLLCDQRSIEFLDSSEIDFVDDERGKGFLVTNPNHKKFRGKFYKKSIWQEKLTKSLAPTNNTSEIH